jgi:hypothetical protein
MIIPDPQAPSCFREGGASLELATVTGRVESGYTAALTVAI